jgi:hypothetical protein
MLFKTSEGQRMRRREFILLVGDASAGRCSGFRCACVWIRAMRTAPLRAGMSVEVDVDIGHARGLPHF